LVQAAGKCTTDSISPAGPWLRFRGHLDKISDNMLLGAVNRFTGNTGETRNPLTGSTGKTPAVARELKAAGRGWIVIGDTNYGEGSSREHAAMEPRHLGGLVVLVRAFARIHETNLKKQGMLPLTFADGADDEKVRADDTIDVTGVATLAPGSAITVTLHHADGTTESFAAKHSMTAQQIVWFKAGGALNEIRRNMA
jgi:aconitate hydratase